MCLNRLFVFPANSICKVMAMRGMKNGKLGSSLTWCLRSKVNVQWFYCVVSLV